MELTEAQKKHLRTRAYDLKPVVIIGQQGLKPTVLEEISGALNFHQLIKVKLNVGDRDLRDEILAQVLQYSQAQLVQRIGNISVLYRRNPDRPDPFKQAV